jgi:hypothetical protein
MAQNTEENSGFIWADKAALIVACAFLSLLAFCWSLAFLTIGSLGTKHLLKYMGVQGIELSMLIAGLVLVVTRGVDFVMGGPTYRLFVASKCYLNFRCRNCMRITTKAAHPQPPDQLPRFQMLHIVCNR